MDHFRVSVRPLRGGFTEYFVERRQTFLGFNLGPWHKVYFDGTEMVYGQRWQAEGALKHFKNSRKLRKRLS